DFTDFVADEPTQHVTGGETGPVTAPVRPPSPPPAPSPTSPGGSPAVVGSPDRRGQGRVTTTKTLQWLQSINSIGSSGELSSFVRRFTQELKASEQPAVNGRSRA